MTSRKGPSSSILRLEHHFRLVWTPLISAARVWELLVFSSKKLTLARLLSISSRHQGDYTGCQQMLYLHLSSDPCAWAKACVQCQCSKVSSHSRTPVGSFSTMFRGKRYFLTCVDKFPRWPEAFSMLNQEGDIVARVFYNGWVCHFGKSL